MLNFISERQLIIEEVKQLINVKTEGIYWDFKKEPHKNKAELLHDIICLANSLHNGNKYLILGIDDEYNIHGVKDSTYRKNQQNYIDFIQGKPFAAQCRPSLRVVTFEIEAKIIDVIVIGDSKDVPFYLTDDYPDHPPNAKPVIVKKNFIYTRIGDTNTPINESADFPTIENIWRKRFGLDIKEQIRLNFLAPLFANIELLEYYILDNQKTIYEINLDYSIVPIDDLCKPPFHSFVDGFNIFEMKILKACIKYYDPIAISNDEQRDKVIMREHMRIRELFGNRIFQRYMPKSHLHYQVKRLDTICKELLCKKDEFIMSSIFAPDEINYIFDFQIRCQVYVEQLNGICMEDDVVLQYPQVINALLKMKQILKLNTKS